MITANKDLLAEHGQEVMAAAEKAGADLEFEAAVAGAIPIIRPLKQSMAGNRISEVMGIVNGTTNYILTKMSEKGMELCRSTGTGNRAWLCGSRPDSRCGGIDAGRKMAIMASIAFNSRVTFPQVYTEWYYKDFS